MLSMSLEQELLNRLENKASRTRSLYSSVSNQERNANDVILSAPIAPELTNFWAGVSARPYELDEKVVSGRGRKAGTRGAREHHDFAKEQDDLDLPLGDGYDMALDLEMQAIVSAIRVYPSDETCDPAR